MVLYWSALSWRVTIALSLKKGRKGLALFLEKGEYSLMCALLLPLIPEGVIGIKPRGDTREKQSTIFSMPDDFPKEGADAKILNIQVKVSRMQEWLSRKRDGGLGE